MSQNRRSNKEIMLLILFAAAVCLGVLNFKTLVEMVKSFAGMLKPFIIGSAIAFVLNLPLKFIEEKWLSHMPGKLQKSKRTIGIVLSLLFFLAVIFFTTLNSVKFFLPAIPVITRSLLSDVLQILVPLCSGALVFLM